MLNAREPRVKSLVVTVFGDAIVPYGATIWMGSLIRLLAPFGVTPRAVRTAVQRLSQEGWFCRRSQGRRTEYSLAEPARRNFVEADRRIYALAPPDWDGHWCLVILGTGSISQQERDSARRALGWHGFGELGPSVLLHPSPDREAVDHTLLELGLDGRAIVLDATSGQVEATASAKPLRGLVASAWKLDRLATAYRAYVRDFAPLEARLDADPAGPPELCFALRILAIHEYRRLLLRDPELPGELLPEGWAGNEARALCARLYGHAFAPSIEYLRATARASGEPLPPVDR
ncbi:MAG: phenylacetic acid degradation operon negative regulatory protein PaaX, partial [bacterium]|nr:phenylacetic acid degradation operon negative regulatory protein PaaX [bacterium]